MQQEREGRNNSIHSSSPFDSFGVFGANRSLMSSIFGGRDPFDDPFFTLPFGSIFGSRGHSGDAQRASRSKGPIIEELSSDDEGEVEEGANDTRAGNKKDNVQSSKSPLVEHPDDQASGEKTKTLQNRSRYNGAEGAQPQSMSNSFRKVTYGGIDGAYYTATTTRRTGSDGVVLEEIKQADRTTGQAAHRISKGMHDKGHTVTRKLDSDGKVDTMQTLHNLSEDDLPGFEQAWKGNVEQHLPGWNEGFTSYANARPSGTGGWALPLADSSGRVGGTRLDNEATTYSSRGRAKKVVRIHIE